MSEKLATQIAVLENEMKNIANKVDEGFKSNSEEHKEIMKAFETAMEKKAGKWVETAITWFLYTIAALLASAIFGAIIWVIKNQ